MMSRRGNIAIILLFVVALVLVVATLMTFVSFKNEYGDSSRLFSETLGEAAFNQQYVEKSAELYGREAILSGGDVKAKFIEIATQHDLRLQGMGNFFGKVRNGQNGQFTFEKQDKGYLLEITGLFVQATRRATVIKRNFDISLKFDEQGKVLGN